MPKHLLLAKGRIKNMKRLWIGIIVLVVAGLALALFLTRGKKEPNEIKVGVVLPLTGEVAVYGQKMKRGIDLAVNQINSKGGINGNQIKVVYEDDQGDPKSAVAAVQKLITTENVPVIIGGAISATALPVVPIIDRNNVVLFSPAATAPKLSGQSKYFFRNWPSDIYDGPAMGEFARKELKLEKVGVLYVNNEWGNAISGLFSDTFKRQGGQIVATESYEQNATDFRTQLTKIARQNPEAIYVPGYLKELINILRQKKELGIKARILSTYGFYDPQILEQGKDAAEGSVFTAPTYDPDNPNPAIKNYVTSFQSTYGEKPDIWSAQAYDAMNIIALALQSGARTGPQIRDEIAKVKNFDGVSGNTSFDEKGDVQKPLRLMTVKNGEFVDYASMGR
jgi:branched-chain amino acid transport system substrate-binding protein